MEPLATSTGFHMVVDTETTSFDPSVERIKSIGGAGGTIADGVTRAFKIYVDSEGRRSSPEAMQIHRIPDEVEVTMGEHDALTILNVMVGDGTVVIQNKAFDIGFLVAAYDRQFMELPQWLRDGGAAIVDTMDLARRRFPGKQLNLDNIGRLVGADQAMLRRRDGKHDVLEDCELTFEVWRRLVTPDRLDLVTERPRQATVDVSTLAEAQKPDWL